MPFVGTSPIVESGSNANGSYVKFADGTMICHGKTADATTSNAAGAVFYNGSGFTVTFPVAFYAAPTVFASAESSAGIVIGARITSVGTAGAMLFLIGSIATNSGHLTWIGIGRWKA